MSFGGGCVCAAPQHQIIVTTRVHTADVPDKGRLNESPPAVCAPMYYPADVRANLSLCRHMTIRFYWCRASYPFRRGRGDQAPSDCNPHAAASSFSYVASTIKHRCARCIRTLRGPSTSCVYSKSWVFAFEGSTNSSLFVGLDVASLRASSPQNAAADGKAVCTPRRDCLERER